MTFRTNQPGSALASLSAFWERSTQNRAMDLRRIPFGTTRLFLFLRWNLSCLPSSFNRHTRRRWLRWPRLLPLSGGGSPHLHSHSMEEQLLNPHYNQSKFSPDRYMMLNRDRDREREGRPLAFRDKSTHRDGANSNVPSGLVWFREPPPPRPLLVF